MDEGIEDQCTTTKEEDLVVFQQNVRASSTVRCHTNTWKIGSSSEDDESELDAWLFSLTNMSEVKIGIFPFAKNRGWENWTWRIDIEVYTDETPHNVRLGQEDLNQYQILRHTERNLLKVMAFYEVAEVESTLPRTENGHRNFDALECVFDHKTSPVTFMDYSKKSHKVNAAAHYILSQGRNMRADSDSALWWMIKATAILPMLPVHLAEHYLVRRGLINGFQQRYWKFSHILDLNAAILYSKQLFDLMEVHKIPVHVVCLASLLKQQNDILTERYGIERKIEDINKILLTHQQTILNIPKSHTCYVDIQLDIARQLLTRYFALSAIADLDLAIEIVYELYKLSETSRLTKSQWRNVQCQLGSNLVQRYLTTKAEPDLENALKILTVTEQEPLQYDSYWAQITAHRALAMYCKYISTKSESALDSCIWHWEQVAKLSDIKDDYYYDWLHHLGHSYACRYNLLDNRMYMDSCIYYLREAAHYFEANNCHRVSVGLCLADALRDRYVRTWEEKDLKESIRLYVNVFNHEGFSTTDRVHAALNIMQRWKHLQDRVHIYQIACRTIDLFGEMMTKVLSTSDKIRLIKHLHGVASTAAAVSLFLNKPPSQALSHLERARNILAHSLEIRHAHIDKLRNVHPRLADEFINIRNIVYDTSGSYYSGQSPSISPWWGSFRFDKETQLRQVLEKIRQEPGFNDFLSPAMSVTEIQNTAKDGPIVIINANELRCDALIVQSDSIEGFQLAQLKNLQSYIRENSLGDQKTLQWLWDNITGPILDSLGLTGPPLLGANWPHIWWIPTGLLTKFPLHAAGYHTDGSFNNVMDRAMSSYASSVKSIIHGREERTLGVAQTRSTALIVSMPETPGMQVHLTSANDEAMVVQKFCESMDIDSSQDCRTNAEVCEQLRECSIFHFAGHGHTNLTDPSKSHIRLDDWQSNPLTVENLLDMNLWDHSPFLAYLSACGTGQVKEDEYTDEGIHLISGFRLAGFRHVIGTLWDVRDSTCVEMARLTYNVMKEKGINDESVCLGLHLATRQLREAWRAEHNLKKGATRGASGRSNTDDADEELSRLARDVTLVACVDESDEEQETGPPAYWVPYVHFGV